MDDIGNFARNRLVSEEKRRAVQEEREHALAPATGD
jgi:hypothetical protein